VDELAADLASPDRETRIRAAGHLERRGRDARPAAPALAHLVAEIAVEKTPRDVRGALLARTALRALALCGEDAAPALESVRALLAGDDADVARAAAACLAAMGPAASASADDLIASLDTDPDAVTALAK